MIEHKDHLEHWQAYLRQIEDRLNSGAEIYGNRNLLSAGKDRLLDEIQQELADVAGWSYLLWCRIQELRTELRERRED